MDIITYYIFLVIFFALVIYFIYLARKYIIFLKTKKKAKKIFQPWQKFDYHTADVYAYIQVEKPKTAELIKVAYNLNSRRLWRILQRIRRKTGEAYKYKDLHPRDFDFGWEINNILDTVINLVKKKLNQLPIVKFIVTFHKK